MTTTKPRNGVRLSVEEFMELDDTWDNRKMELDYGALYIRPRPRIVHNFAQNAFLAHFREYRNRAEGPSIQIYTGVAAVGAMMIASELEPEGTKCR